jgi:tetratricopeptide (TPR) repeat protein
VSNETVLAKAVLGDAEAQALQREWQGGNRSGTNSIAYRDRLWRLAWEQYQDSLANRGRLNTPNLFMERGRLLVSQGQFQAAVVEFQNALRFAEASGYVKVRQETVVHALRAIGTAYWHLGDFRTAQPYFVRAQQTQRASGRVWIASLDEEVQQVTALAAMQR